MGLKTFSDDELGDYQTPPELVSQIVERLIKEGWRWGRVLEPTCGVGNFITAILKSSAHVEEVIGLELDPGYVKTAQSRIEGIAGKKAIVEERDIFSVNLKEDIQWSTTSPLLVIGNPPWVTNSKIGSIDGKNLPKKTNVKGLSGFDAVTGASNFDLTEFIIIKIISELKEEHPTVAMLCKTSVARNVLSFCQRKNLSFHDSKIYKIDALKWFNAATDACLFVFSVDGSKRAYELEVFESLDSEAPIKKIGFQNGRIISDKSEYFKHAFLEGAFPLVWRQGIKHDAASVVELTKSNKKYFNKIGQQVDIEEEYVFPLVKSSDLNKFNEGLVNRFIVLPQRRLHEDISYLNQDAPKLWSYLNKNIGVFQRRKSSVYRNHPRFTYFGLGDYTFARYKVAVSGLYKKPVFRALGPYSEKPIILDDTCYFVPTETLEQARQLADALNSEPIRLFLKTITFEENMRPITKNVLQRININELKSSPLRKNPLLNF